MVRYKKRYLVLSVKLKNKYRYVTADTVKDSIIQAVNTLYGEIGAASILNGFYVKYSNSSTGIYYVKVSREAHPFIAAAISSVTSFGNDEGIISCIYKGATIRHANIFLKDYDMKKLVDSQKEAETKEATGHKRQSKNTKKNRVQKEKSGMLTYTEKVKARRKKTV